MRFLELNDINTSLIDVDSIVSINKTIERNLKMIQIQFNNCTISYSYKNKCDVEKDFYKIKHSLVSFKDTLEEYKDDVFIVFDDIEVIWNLQLKKGEMYAIYNINGELRVSIQQYMISLNWLLYEKMGYVGKVKDNFNMYKQNQKLIKI